MQGDMHAELFRQRDCVFISATSALTLETRRRTAGCILESLGALSPLILRVASHQGDGWSKRALCYPPRSGL